MIVIFIENLPYLVVENLEQAHEEMEKLFDCGRLFLGKRIKPDFSAYPDKFKYKEYDLNTFC